jgi:hypothetical protein
MKFRIISVLALNVITSTIFCLNPAPTSEDKIKSSLKLTFREPWETTKQKITDAINEGVQTVDVQKYDNWGYTPLCEALQNDDIPFAQFLLSKGANPNFAVKGVHSSSPIFFAKSVEMVKLLKEHGADLTVYNEGSGFSSGMNLLHQAINCNTADSNLFNYLLEQGFDPKKPADQGANLWHSLISVSIRYCPEDRFIERAEKLHKLGISPHEQGKKGTYHQLSAAQLLEKEIAEEREYLSRSDVDTSRTEMLEQMEHFLQVMKKQK